MTIEELINKAKAVEKGEKLDLSSDEDLSIGIMNLISIEEHLFFTAQKTQKTQYYDLLNEVRDMRKQLLKQIIKDYEGEVWCISKHLLAGCVRFMEVGTKMLTKGDNTLAHNMFSKAYKLYSMFWALNLKLISPEDVKREDSPNINIQKDEETPKSAKVSMMDKIGEVVKKLVDCCKE
mgnify:CR=1 FL=1